MLHRSFATLAFALQVLLGQAQSTINVGSSDCDNATVDPGPGVTLLVGTGTRVWVNGGPETLVLDGTLVVYGLPFASTIPVIYRPQSLPSWLSPLSCNFFTTAPSAPDNDEDCTAETIVPATSCSPVPGTLKGATNTDVWYTFQPGPNGHSSIAVAPDNAEVLQATVYEGLCGGGLSDMATSTSFAPGQKARINQSGLIEGQTYYVQVASASVDSRSADFTICVTQAGQAYDCLGVAGGPAVVGTPCNDGNGCTTNDVWGPGCSCAGVSTDTDGDGTCDTYDHCDGGPEPGTHCNDGDACTFADVIGWDCQCAGTLIDLDNDGTPDCNDGCPGDAAKTAPGQCGCFNADTDSDSDGIADCLDLCDARAGTQGSPCDDGDPLTSGDVIDFNCQCAGGTPPAIGFDCLGVIGGSAVPGTPCQDALNPNCSGGSNTSIWTANCTCTNVCPNADGDFFEDASDPCPSTPTEFSPPYCAQRCKLANGAEGSLNGDCVCVATVCSQSAAPFNYDIDADGIISPASASGTFDNCATTYGVIGTPCQDGDPLTVNDVVVAGCGCEGIPAVLDCLGVPGGTALPGTPCIDEISDEVWTEDCACVQTGIPTPGTKPSFQLRPNPVENGIVLITTNTAWSGAQLQVLDLSGRAVLTTNLPSLITRTATVDLSKLAPGGYLVHISGGGRSAAQRLLIQR